MTPPYGLQGRAAVVTGATRGIGLAAARALGGAGLPGDVADPADSQAPADFCGRELGRLDIVVNNAATNRPYGPLMDVDPLAWRTRSR
jgi:3-oxoacyl-[acyl-carrier protein] reductase